VNWLLDPTDARVKVALSWTCDVCSAPVAALCTNTCRPGEVLPGRVVHFGRLVDRRRK
jgi:hypothetical protein